MTAAGPVDQARQEEAPSPDQSRRLRLGRARWSDPRPPCLRQCDADSGQTSSTSPAAGTEADQSLISYFRPLQDGDVLTYEFLYEPGQIVVHPAVGRIAFLLEPEGVKVHWMTEGGRDLSGLAADNAVVEPGNRRGPATLPLKPGQWNAVRLAIDGAKVTLELNGQAVYERVLEPAVGREFGLFHYKDQTAAQARNVVLRGRWPETLDKARLAGLLAPDPAVPNTAADRRARHTLIGESIFALEAGEVVERASKLPAGEAYAQLASWVLPSPDHPVLRLAGDFSPSFPAATLVPQKRQQARVPTAMIDAHHKVRLQTGGELRAPALALIDAAKSLAKLDELAAQITAIKLDGGDPADSNERAKLAFAGLIAIARGDDSVAAQALKASKPLLAKLSADAPECDALARAGPGRAGDRSGRRSVSRPSSCSMSWPSKQNRKKPTQAENKLSSELWTHQINNIRARATLLAESEKSGAGAAPAFGTDPDVRAMGAGHADSGRDTWHGRADPSLGVERGHS